MHGTRKRSGYLVGTAALTILAAAPVAADVYGPSNFGAFTYPSHECGPRPAVPQRPSGMSAHFEAQDYNARVEEYNLRIERYSRCINEYIERARLDMQRIHEKQLQAAREAQ